MPDLPTRIVEGAFAFLGVLLSIATMSLMLSKQSNLPADLQAGQQAFSGALGTAMSPVTGSTGTGANYSG